MTNYTDVDGPVLTELDGTPIVESPTWPRLGLPALGWLFVGLAAVDVFLGWPSWLRPDERQLGAIVDAIAGAGVVLLPAALLYRDPRAWQNHRLLLAAPMVAAAFQLFLAVVFRILAEGVRPDEAASLLSALTYAGVASGLAALLLGLGLARLRTGPMRSWSRQPLILLLAIGLAAVGTIHSPLLEGGGAPASAANGWLPSLAIAGFVSIALSYQAWVALGGWQAGDQPRRFWSAVAAAALAAILMQVIVALQVVLRAGADPSAYQWFIVLMGIVSAIASALFIVAFARYLPRPAGPIVPASSVRTTSGRAHR